MKLLRLSSRLATCRQLIKKLLTRPIITARCITYSHTMLDSEEQTNKIKEMKREMFLMYQNAVSAVKPGKLVSRVIKKSDDNNFIINGRKYLLNKNVYVVGFGKAVLDMALEVNKILGDHIVQGILSVPVGIKQPPETEAMNKRNVEIREGAAGNLPDQNAEYTARDISNLAESLKDGMILLVLISGGGSALLPAPLPGITVEETAELVFKLQSKGASINEVNSVRKKLCSLKGGKLAIKTSPAHMISFILSDVIGDPLDFIASGPTVENTDSPNLPYEIIKKYELEKEISDNIVHELMKVNEPVNFPHNNVFNILIGSNKTALEAAQEVAVKAKYFPLIISDKIDIPVTELSEWYSSLCVTFYKAQESHNYQKLNDFFKAAVKRYAFSSDIVKKLLEFAPRFRDNDVKGLCIIGGGEPTVKVNKKCDSKGGRKCDGKGGRSQELALRFSVNIHKLSKKENCNNMMCVLMAAGTDGIDGPTDAAGAFGYSEQIYLANEKGLEPQNFIENSNSYGYFSLIPDDMIKVGHTGTNVMDLHVILIKKM